MAQKPISTCMSDALIFIFRLCIFILFGNPLSMFIHNLLFPEETAEFARNRNIFGAKIYTFYERLALTWPFYWAKWWMKLDKLSDYTPNQQVQYLLKVAFRNQTEVEALKAMSKEELWPAAYEKLFVSYGKLCLPLRQRDVRDRNYMPKWYMHYVAEFMMQNVRLSYQALKNVIAWAAQDEQVMSTLKQYLASGKLNDAQFMLLTDAVSENQSGGNLKLLDVVIDYVKRYGISTEHMAHVRARYPRQFFELVADAKVLYTQTKAVKAFKDTCDGVIAWREFCLQTRRILPEVQSQMSHMQYEVFHNVGHKLDVMAIKEFLWRQDKELWRAVFINEKEMCSTGEMREHIRKNANLEQAYRETLEAQQKTSQE